eukprot:6933229-Prymnesium_polylepis.1
MRVHTLAPRPLTLWVRKHTRGRARAPARAGPSAPPRDAGREGSRVEGRERRVKVANFCCRFDERDSLTNKRDFCPPPCA